MRTRRFIAAASALALTAGLTQLAPSARAAATVNSPNLTLLANLKQKLGKADGTPSSTAPASTGFGSDIEFLTDVDVTGLVGAGTTTGVRDFALAGSLSAGLQIVDIT